MGIGLLACAFVITVAVTILIARSLKGSFRAFFGVKALSAIVYLTAGITPSIILPRGIDTLNNILLQDFDFESLSEKIFFVDTFHFL